MRSRLARLGMIVGGLLGLLGVMTPPVQATTVGSLAFLGTATLGAGLGYPCFPTTAMPPTGDCPGTNVVSTSTLPLQHFPDNVHVNVTGGRTQAFTLVTAACVNAVVNIAKLAKAPAHVGTCGLQAAGNVTGWCGLSSSNGVALFTDALGQQYRVTFHFTGLGGTLVVQGHVRKLTNPPPNGEGLFVGVVEAVPVPVPLTLPTLGNSCSLGTATTFQVVGSGDYVFLNTLPPITP